MTRKGEGLICDLYEASLGVVQRMSGVNQSKAVSEIAFEDFKKLDARVGTITEVERVPRTDVRPSQA
jgi:hypothetical protein